MEKRFPPTQKKLKKARAQGDIAKSREISGGSALVVGACYLGAVYFGYQALEQFFIQAFHGLGDFHIDSMLVYAWYGLRSLLLAVVPFFLVVFFTVFLVEVLQVGMVISFEPLKFKFERLNVFNGLKRLLGFEREATLPFWYEGAKSVVYLLGLSAIFFFSGFFFFGRMSIGDVLSADFFAVEEVLDALYWTTVRAVGPGLLFILVVSGVDYLYQRARRMKRLSMDATELRKEFREDEGAPEMRGLRKNLHQELLLQEIVSGVRKGRVIVVNKESIRL